MIEHLVRLLVFQQFLTAIYYLQGRNGYTDIENWVVNKERQGESEITEKNQDYHSCCNNLLEYFSLISLPLIHSY